jgi:hypothetical protein
MLGAAEILAIQAQSFAFRQVYAAMGTSDHTLWRPRTAGRTATISRSSLPLSPKQISNRNQQKKRKPLHHASSASAVQDFAIAAKYSDNAAPERSCAFRKRWLRRLPSAIKVNARLSNLSYRNRILLTISKDKAQDLRTFGFRVRDAVSRLTAIQQMAGIYRIGVTLARGVPGNDICWSG